MKSALWDSPRTMPALLPLHREDAWYRQEAASFIHAILYTAEWEPKHSLRYWALNLSQ